MTQRRFHNLRENGILDELHSYLDHQSEEFDESDIGSIINFLARREDPLEQDWSRVKNALRNQATFDEAAGQALALLERLTGNVDEQIAGYLKLHKLPRPLVFVVGAGASAPAPTSIPTVTNLLPVLWNKAEEIGNKLLLRLRDQCAELSINNIEELLSGVYLAQSAAGNPKISGLIVTLLRGDERGPSEMRRVQTGVRARSPILDGGIQGPGRDIVYSLRESVQTLFSVLVGMMVGKPVNNIHNTLASFSTQANDVRIITTNYDICVETAIGEGNFSYGFNPVGRAQDRSLPTVLKLHGSLNWYSCLNCDDHLAAPLEAINTAAKAGLYPVLAQCRQCQATSQQLIVPPIAEKYHTHPVLLDIRQAAEEALTSARTIVVVGYSFAEADEYVLRMFSRAVAADNDKNIIVLDISQTPGLTLKRFLGTHVRNYDSENKIASFVGDATETLPLIVGGVKGQIKSEERQEESTARPTEIESEFPVSGQE